MTRIRHDVAGLTLGDPVKAETQDWHPVLGTYARGVALMLELDDDDPRSWVWAANTHGIRPGTPTRPTWAQCAHGSVSSSPGTVRTSPGSRRRSVFSRATTTGRVPYWDYSVPGDVADRSLPAEFGVATRTGGTVVDNPLFVGGRNDDAIPVDDIDIVGALSERRFVRSFQRGFGGVDPVSRTGSSRWDRTTSSTSTSAG